MHQSSKRTMNPCKAGSLQVQARAELGKIKDDDENYEIT